ncbi:zinc finger protein-like [Tropilaelaps mercedesae]|uniref:Zinc finger protein-like n=1 Tax=Tropilaelaps mercedesae TaxID=418985 RepID=A0A1V9XAK9_9ACAR|nr:zinc finger protein-like [Tropilaelaps mercedesae]
MFPPGRLPLGDRPPSTKMDPDLIVPDVEPNNNASEDTKCSSITSMVTTKVVGGSSASHTMPGGVKMGALLPAASNPCIGPAPCPVVSVTSRGLLPSMMIRPVMSLAPSAAGGALMLPQFVPIRPASHTRQAGVQLPVQSMGASPKTLAILPKTPVDQPTSSGLPMPLVSVQIGSQHQHHHQQHHHQPMPSQSHPAQLSGAHQGSSAVTVVKLPPGTDIEALTSGAVGHATQSTGGGGDSRGKAGQFWQYVCGDCPYSTGDYKQYKRHRAMAHDTSKMQTKVCHICNKGFLDLDNHLKVHENGRKHVCDVCDLGFHSPIELENHASKKHQGRQFLKCGYCDASVAKEDISQHLNACEPFRKQQHQQPTAK